MSVAILDGDIIAYRAACVGVIPDDFGEPGEVIYSLPTAIDAANTVIRRWTEGARCDAQVVAFSCYERNFRYQVYPQYKHSRRSEKPPLYADVVKYIEDNYKVLRKPLLEADDVIGILASSDPKRFVGVSIDKDLKTVPGRIFNPDKDAIPRTITEGAADQFWLMQTLTGDSVDGYPGCPKVGPVGAKALLSEIRSAERGWPIVVDAFKTKGLTEDVALQQARLARILRDEDFDRNTREILLWHPTTPTRLITPTASLPAEDTTSTDPLKKPSPSTQEPPLSVETPSTVQSQRNSSQGRTSTGTRRGKRRRSENTRGM